jgi:predicted flap endonuclease-1-like 5' DNA nuclease
MWESLRHSMEIGVLRHRFAAVHPARSRRRSHTTHSSQLEVRVGWFIAQSLAFIIIAALIGLAIGIWIGWLVWGHRAKGKHTAERAEAASRASAADTSTGTAVGGTPDAETAVGTDTVLPVADSAAEADEAVTAVGTTTAVEAPADADGTGDDTADDAEAGTGDGEAEVEAAESDVVAEAEAVARKAAEADSVAKAAATAENDDAPAAPETPDNLRRIEGIGPKIASALVAAGYPTYAKIAAATEDELREAVAGQGIKFAPSASSWADQAQYLVDSDADGLEEYQDYLVGGQERRAKFNEKVDYADVDEIEGADAKAAALAEDEAEAAAVTEAEATPEPAPEPAPEPEPQDLQRIEGIGSKIESALTSAGYTTYAKIAGASEDELRAALTSAGITFAPAATSWADQAQYLVDGDEDGLQEYQDYLIGGQDRASKFKENVDYADVDEIEGAEAKAAALAEDEAEAAAVAEAEATPEPEPQDLQRIEGIGPKIESTLKSAGYTTYAKIAAASETELREALATGGIKFAPAATSWADQAQYLADGDEDGLQEYQDYLVGGQERRAKFSENVDYTDVDEIEDADAKAAALAADEAKVTAEGDSEQTGSEVKA